MYKSALVGMFQIEKYVSLLTHWGRVLQTNIHKLGALVFVPSNSKIWIVLTITLTSVWIKLLDNIYFYKTAVQSNISLIYIVLLRCSEMCFDGTLHTTDGY